MNQGGGGFLLGNNMFGARRSKVEGKNRCGGGRARRWGGPIMSWGDGDMRGPMGIESVASGGLLNIWCASFREGEATY
jgi:hypothetical protein